MQTPALVVPSPGAPFKYTHLTLTLPPRPDELHIRISATGICHTDLIFSREDKLPHMFPCVMGHEGAGTIISVGSSVTDLVAGDKVICVYSCCGTCEYCKRKETGYCDMWFQMNFGVGRGEDGSKVFADKKGARVTGHFFGQSSFAREVLVKRTGVVKVPRGFEGVAWERLAALACGVMTGAGAMVNVVGEGLRGYTDMDADADADGEESENNVCVVGTGSVGLSSIMAVKLLDERKRPRRVIAVDVVPGRLEVARTCGATHGVNSKVRTNLMETLLDITDGRGVNGAIDTTGRADVITSLVHSCARKGKVVTVGTGGTKSEVTLNLFEMVQAGCSYVGCQQGDCYPQEFIPMLLQANRDGKFPYEKLIKTYPVKEFAQAMEDMESGKVIKPVLLWD